MAVRAPVVDVFGTLVDWRSGVGEAFRASGVSGDPEELADGWRARYWPMLAEVNAGERPWGNFDDQHLVTLDDLLTERGADLPVEAGRRLVGAWHRLDPWPDVRSGLEALRAQRVIATLSNGHVALLVDLARHADLRFDFSEGEQRDSNPRPPGPQPEPISATTPTCARASLPAA
jgi:2-haloacid dehalogenase